MKQAINVRLEQIAGILDKRDADKILDVIKNNTSSRSLRF